MRKVGREESATARRALRPHLLAKVAFLDTDSACVATLTVDRCAKKERAGFDDGAPALGATGNTRETRADGGDHVAGEGRGFHHGGSPKSRSTFKGSGSFSVRAASAMPRPSASSACSE